MIRTTLLLCLLTAGCSDSNPTNPSVQPPPTTTQAAAPTPPACIADFDPDLSIDAHNAKPSVFKSKKLLDAYYWEALDGSIGAEAPSFTGYEFDSIETLPPGAYHVKVEIGCWSAWQDFTITPNPNASGELPAPVVPEKPWNQEVCSPPGFGYWEGHSTILILPAPATELYVTYEDWTHGDGTAADRANAGQNEIVGLEGVGFTDDLPDDVRWAAKSFTVAVPITQVLTRSISGSIRRLCIKSR